jgi:hypothetical protein
MKSEWKGTNAGGCGNFPTWKNNPQFAFNTQIFDEVFITLMQDDVRMQGVRESNIPIGFLILKGTDTTNKIMQLRGPDVVGQTTFNNNRESKYFRL